MTYVDGELPRSAAQYSVRGLGLGDVGESNTCDVNWVGQFNHQVAFLSRETPAIPWTQV